MKDLYSFTAHQHANQVIADLVPEVNGDKWLVYPPSHEPTQIVVSPGQSIFIEVRVPNDGPAFVRYYRGE